MASARGPRGTMPWSVRIAAFAVGVVVLVALAALALVLRAGAAPWTESAQLAAYAALFGLLLAGILARRRLAWLWGRYLGFFLFAVAVAGVLTNAGRLGGPGIAAIVLGFAAPLLVTSLALGRLSALAWFGLVCPSCDLPSTRGDLLMRTIRCSRCGSTF